MIRKRLKVTSVVEIRADGWKIKTKEEPRYDFGA